MKSTKNPIAKDLRTPKYRQRVVQDPNVYNRKKKHKNKEDVCKDDRTNDHSSTCPFCVIDKSLEE